MTRSKAGRTQTRNRRPKRSSQPKRRGARIGIILLLAASLTALSVAAWLGPESTVWLRLRALIPGQVVKVVVVEGATGFDVAGRLAAQGICSETAFLGAFRDRQLLESLGVPFATAEGYLAPATYDFFRESRPEKVLARMVRRRLADFLELASLAPPNPLTSREDVLVLASLVEAEAKFSDERARIASVFVNRLREPRGETHGRLQSDPSAAYGCRAVPEVSAVCQAHQATPHARVTPTILRDPANPYNTYRHSGLPPGPISNPGLASLRAAFSPEATEDFYFVADRGSRHRFARTYAEHQRNIAELARGRPESSSEALPKP